MADGTRQRCANLTAKGKPCPVAVLKGAPDPDGKRRCPHHSIRPDAIEARARKGEKGAQASRKQARKREAREAKAAAALLDEDGGPPDLNTREGVMRALEVAAHGVLAGVLVPDAGRAVAAICKAAVSLHGAEDKRKATTPGARFVVVRTREEAQALTRSDDDDDDEGAAVVN